MRFKHIITSIFASCCLFLVQAAKAEPLYSEGFKATFNGTVGSSGWGTTDIAGLFGAAGADLGGQNFTFKFTVLSAFGKGIDAFSGAIPNGWRDYFGGYTYDNPSFISGAFTIGGTTISLFSKYQSQITLDSRAASVEVSPGVLGPDLQKIVSIGGYFELSSPGEVGILANLGPISGYRQADGVFESIGNPTARFEFGERIFGTRFALNSQTARIEPIASVPGPVAGAGLPILVTGAGFMLWRRRSRNSSAVI